MKNLILLSLLLLAFACDCDVAPSSGASSVTSSFGQPPVENVSSIVAGSQHACALLEDEEEIRCWGSNGDNQLDLGSAKNAQITLDASKTRFSKISAGDSFVLNGKKKQLASFKSPLTVIFVIVRGQSKSFAFSIDPLRKQEIKAALIAAETFICL